MKPVIYHPDHLFEVLSKFPTPPQFQPLPPVPYLLRNGSNRTLDYNHGGKLAPREVIAVQPTFDYHRTPPELHKLGTPWPCYYSSFNKACSLMAIAAQYGLVFTPKPAIEIAQETLLLKNIGMREEDLQMWGWCPYVTEAKVFRLSDDIENITLAQHTKWQQLDPRKHVLVCAANEKKHCFVLDKARLLELKCAWKENFSSPDEVVATLPLVEAKHFANVPLFKNG